MIFFCATGGNRGKLGRSAGSSQCFVAVKMMKSLLGLPWTLISGVFLFIVYLFSGGDERVGRCLLNVHADYMACGWFDGFYAIHEESNEMGLRRFLSIVGFGAAVSLIMSFCSFFLFLFFFFVR